MIISNDSDLAGPISVVTTRFNKRVIVFNPHRPKTASQELVRVASVFKQLRPWALAASQFPGQLADARGVITKPAGW